MLHDKAVAAAMNAAFAVSESETWMFGLDGSQEPGKAARKAWEKSRPDWLGFILDNQGAPVEALWIRAGALGFHDGETPYFKLSTMVVLAFRTFHMVFRDVSFALDTIVREEAERVLAEERAAAAVASPPPAPDLTGTPLEPFDDPMAPSAFARPAPAAQPEGEGARDGNG